MAPRPLHIAGWALITALVLTAALAVTAPGLREAVGLAPVLADVANPTRTSSLQEPLPSADQPSRADDWPPSGAATPWEGVATTASPFPTADRAVVDDRSRSGGDSILPAARSTPTVTFASRGRHLVFEPLPPPPSDQPTTASVVPAIAPIDLLVNQLTLLRQDLQQFGRASDPAAEVRTEVQSLRNELAALAEQRRLEALHDDLRRLASRQDSLESQLQAPVVAQTVEPSPAVPAPQLPSVAEPAPSAVSSPVAIEISPSPGDPTRFAVHLVDADPAQVVRQIGQIGGGNLVLSAQAAGRVSLSLAAATPEELLQALAAALDCAVIEDGPVRLIIPAEQAAQRRAAAEQTIARLIRPAYISAQDLVPLVLPMLTPGLGEVGVTPPDPVSGDAPARAQPDALLVVDFPGVVAQVETMLCEVDVPPQQFVIDAVITTIAWNQRTACGVVPALQQTGVCSAPLRRERSPGSGRTDDARLGRGRAAQVGQFRGRPQDLLAHLSQLGELRVEATPTLHVLNRQWAEVEVGANVAYRDSVTFGKRMRLLEEEIDFLPTRTALSVRPFLQGGDTVRLQVHPRVTHVHSDPLTRLPREAIAELCTDVTIPLGCTAVIGGLTQCSEETSPAATTMQRWLGRRRGPAPTTCGVEHSMEVVILLTPRRADEATNSPPSRHPTAIPEAAPQGPALLPASPAPHDDMPPATPAPRDYMPPALPDLEARSSAAPANWLQKMLGQRVTPTRVTPTRVSAQQSRRTEAPPMPELPVPDLEEPEPEVVSDRGDWGALELPMLNLTAVVAIPVEYPSGTVAVPHEGDAVPASTVGFVPQNELVPPEPSAAWSSSDAPRPFTPSDTPREVYVPPEPAPLQNNATLDLSLVPPPPPENVPDPPSVCQPAPFIPPPPVGRPRRALQEFEESEHRGHARRQPYDESLGMPLPRRDGHRR